MVGDEENKTKVGIAGIGASAGGIEALETFFTSVPPDLGLAYVVILHLSPTRESELPAILSRDTKMPVTQVADGQQFALESNHVYVIAPDSKLTITDTSVSAIPFDEGRGQRTTIDVFFRSLAATHSDGFAIVLSGSGSDGALGAKAVKEAGGLVLVQDPAEAGHDGMPRAVITSGVADLVLPVRELADRLAHFARRRKEILPLFEAKSADAALPAENDGALIVNILELLRIRTGHDFSKYKRATILRRLGRRMFLTHQSRIADYLAYLKTVPEEVQSLFGDFLISVTNFFRDRDAWTALQSKVIQPLIDQTDASQSIRVWVPGCATGEEAYSIAMLISEELDRQKKRCGYVIFASDIDEEALSVAREGVYLKTIVEDVGQVRMDRFFVKERDQFRVIQELRDRVVFATHNVLRDAPFSKINLISCRNLLIYLDRDLQEQVQKVLHYACRDDGFLFIGISETVDPDLYKAVDKSFRIFQARKRPGDVMTLPPFFQGGTAGYVKDGRPHRPHKQQAGELHSIMLEQLSPPSVLIDERGTVLHLSESAGRYLQLSGGPLANLLSEIVRPELRAYLQDLATSAFTQRERRNSAFIPVKFNGKSRQVALVVDPREKDGEIATALVTFLEGGEVEDIGRAETSPGTEPRVRAYAEKLRLAESRMQEMAREHHTANEDLRAANEELQSLNEEYRSTTEELETSKEELQSVNEELQTVNNELKIKLDEVSRAHSDLENFMSATDIATLFLDRELQIVRFTPKVMEFFNLRLQDKGRPIGDITHNLVYPDLQRDIRDVVTNLTPIEKSVRTVDDRNSMIVRIRPYRTLEHKIDGVIVTLLDVTELYRVRSDLRGSENRLDWELTVSRRLHRMTAISMAAQKMEYALHEILSTVTDLLMADFAAIKVTDPKSHHVIYTAETDSIDKHRRKKIIEDLDRLDLSPASRVNRLLEPVWIEDTAKESDRYADMAERAGFRSEAIIPLLDRGRGLIGVLSLYYVKPRTFGERDKQLAEILSRQATDLIMNRYQQDVVDELNKTLTERASELEKSREILTDQANELRIQDQKKEEFLDLLGHELRNPLAAIHNSLELIKNAGGKDPGEMNASVVRGVDIIRRQHQHTLRLVDDLLDITRIKRGKLHLKRKPVDICQCVAEVVDTLRAQFEQHGITHSLKRPEHPVYVYVDPDRLAQIVDNILRNAITYSNRGGKVSVTVSADKDFSEVSIRDNGTGIDPSELSIIFEPYRQASTARGKGLGLGLALVKRLVEMQGGSVAAISKGEGSGAEFRVSLPLATEGPAVAVESTSAKPAPHRILVVDDERDIADTFADLLKTLSQEVEVAYNGADALKIANKWLPHAAFVDVTMSGMDGRTLAKRLRETLPDVVVVALTGHAKKAGKGGFERWREFDHHLLKPAQMDVVAELLKSLPEK